MTADGEDWKPHFWIQSEVDLDFVIGQAAGFPIGMKSGSPAEFKRRVLAAMVSYKLRLKSMDYALKQYVDPDQYEMVDASLGEEISHYLRDASSILQRELAELHTQGKLSFGILGAELTLYRLPNLLDAARMLANRGLLLEVLPLLRLALEMMAWAHAAFRIVDNDAVLELKAQNCISSLKGTYRYAGRLYGELSRFAHWGHAIHGKFIDIDKEKVSIVNASVRYRAMSLAFCLVILDVFVEVIRNIYAEKSDPIVSEILVVACPDIGRKPYQYVARIAEMVESKEISEIQSLLQCPQ